MAFKIVYTENALADLEAVLDYILADNPAAAFRFGDDLLNHVEQLEALEGVQRGRHNFNTGFPVLAD